MLGRQLGASSFQRSPRLGLKAEQAFWAEKCYLLAAQLCEHEVRLEACKDEFAVLERERSLLARASLELHRQLLAWRFAAGRGQAPDSASLDRACAELEEQLRTWEAKVALAKGCASDRHAPGREEAHAATERGRVAATGAFGGHSRQRHAGAAHSDLARSAHRNLPCSVVGGSKLTAPGVAAGTAAAPTANACSACELIFALDCTLAHARAQAPEVGGSLLRAGGRRLQAAILQLSCLFCCGVGQPRRQHRRGGVGAPSSAEPGARRSAEGPSIMESTPQSMERLSSIDSDSSTQSAAALVPRMLHMHSWDYPMSIREKHHRIVLLYEKERGLFANENLKLRRATQEMVGERRDQRRSGEQAASDLKRADAQPAAEPKPQGSSEQQVSRTLRKVVASPQRALARTSPAGPAT